jgi:carbon-monoxide dehydrogenase medium subunit
MTRHREIELLPWLRHRCPMVAEAVAMIGHVAIRNRGTVGGSMAHADPAAEWGAVALALDAQIEVVGADGARVIPAQDFFTGYFATALAPTEVVREIRLSLPERDRRTGSAFLELARQDGDFAVVAAATAVTLADDGTVADARVALAGVSDVVVRSRLAESALIGRHMTEEAIAEAAQAIDPEIRPPEDAYATAEFRRHVSKVMVGRTLAVACTRAESHREIR